MYTSSDNQPKNKKAVQEVKLLFGSKNSNLGHTDLGRNSNSVLITEGGLRIFTGKRRKIR